MRPFPACQADWECLAVSEQWVKAISVEGLHEKRAAVVRLSGKQLAIFEHSNGVLACNNRCPHEGYPLSEGSLDGKCVLTCNWHNWKFDLKSGSNLYGGDRLRIYPTQTRNGDIWVDISDPPIDVQKSEVMSNLREAYDDHEYDRLAREIGRWQLLGADPVEVVAAGIEWSFERMQFGWTHAFVSEPIALFLDRIALRPHFVRFAEGIVTAGDIVYFAASTALSASLVRLSLVMRRVTG